MSACTCQVLVTVFAMASSVIIASCTGAGGGAVKPDQADTSARKQKNFMAMIMPDHVTIGMSIETFKTVRLAAMTITEHRLTFRTNGIVVVEALENRNSFPNIYQYLFVENQLRAVLTGALPGREGYEKNIKSVRAAMTNDLVKKDDFKILRINAEAKTVVEKAGLWMDSTKSLGVYVVDTAQELMIAIFDPAVVGRKDFFMSPEDKIDSGSSTDAVRK